MTPISYDAYRGRRHFPALDGLRGLAILGVLLHHTRHGPFALLHGYRGVWVFFVLSGFLITTLALRQESQFGQLNIRAFAIRRVFRIMPLYYLTLGVYWVAVLYFGLEANGQGLREHLGAYLLYSSEFPIFFSHFHVPFGQSWSLGIEEKFYLAWPIIAFWLLRKSRYRIAVTVALVGVTAVLTATSGELAQVWGSYTDILLGCLVAQLLHQRKFYERLAFLGRTDVAWLLVLAFGAATVRPGGGSQIEECLYALLAAAVLVGLVTSDSGPVRLLTPKWLVLLGAWSYAIYLTHTLCLEIVSRLVPAGHLGDLLTLPAGLMIILPLCWLLHVSVEQPLIGLGRELSNRVQVSTSAAPDAGSLLADVVEPTVAVATGVSVSSGRRPD